MARNKRTAALVANVVDAELQSNIRKMLDERAAEVRANVASLVADWRALSRVVERHTARLDVTDPAVPHADPVVSCSGFRETVESLRGQLWNAVGDYIDTVNDMYPALGVSVVVNFDGKGAADAR